MISPELVAAYWKHYLSADKDEYFWAQDEVCMMFIDFENNSLTALLESLNVLVDAAPDEDSLGYLAAGPFEDFLEEVLKRKDAKMAKTVVESNRLHPLLESILPRDNVQKMKDLAKANR